MNSLTAKKYEWLLKGSHGRAAPVDVFKDLPNKNVVVFWSGGVDSTLAVIAACLACDDVKVVSIKAFTPNQHAERVIREKAKPALERIASDCHAKVSFKEIEFNLPIRATSGWGQMPWWITNAQYIAQEGEAAVVFGWISTDDNAGVFDSAIKAMHAFDFCDVPGFTGPELLLPLRYYSKGEVVKHLRSYLTPAECKMITWCESPISVCEVVKHSIDSFSDEEIEQFSKPGRLPITQIVNPVPGDSYHVVDDNVLGHYVEQVVDMQYVPCGQCASCRGMERVLRTDFEDRYVVGQYEDYRRATLGRSLQIEERDVYFSDGLKKIIGAHLGALVARWPEGSDRRPPNLAKVMVSEPVRNSSDLFAAAYEGGSLIQTTKYFRIDRAWGRPKSLLTYDILDVDHINGMDALLLRNEPTTEIEFARVVDVVLSQLLTLLYRREIIKNNGTPLMFDLRALEKWRALVKNLLSSIFQEVAVPAAVRGTEWKEPTVTLGGSEC